MRVGVRIRVRIRFRVRVRLRDRIAVLTLCKLSQLSSIHIHKYLISSLGFLNRYPELLQSFLNFILIVFLFSSSLAGAFPRCTMVPVGPVGGCEDHLGLTGEALRWHVAASEVASGDEETLVIHHRLDIVNGIGHGIVNGIVHGVVHGIVHTGHASFIRLDYDAINQH